MNALVECDGRPFQRFECHRTRDVSETNKPFRAMKRKRADSAHRLRAVEQRETFFHLELQRCDLRALESSGRGQSFAFVEHFALADCCKREMCEWREIAARAYASLFR